MTFARLSFACATAFMAAVFGDAMLEAISNSMILWRGDYTDRSSLDLVPVSLVSLLALLAVAWLVVRRELAAGRVTERSLVLSASRLFAPREVARMLPAIIALQLATLFTMETLEQAVAYGHPLGGLLWLGAPALASLAVHAALGIGCAFVLARCAASFASVFYRLVRKMLALVRGRQAAGGALKPDVSFRAGRLLLVTEVGERGPPII